ncbi:uncharacterized protein DNG_03939 [Cephalotrichum gorgonifer]|uniref:Uncharacterized protein n=1 Tax=Cephalotrichum gorgonifer TaxID=2041049 RepID=A0AAE8MVN2_9PEZI|nr:uncharacterized protein DNG_03939 [Cephalotrichum gorgonifer]
MSLDSPQFGPYCGPPAWFQACGYVWRNDIRLLDLLVHVSVHERPPGKDSLLEESCSPFVSARTFKEVLRFAAPDRLDDVDARSRGLIHRLIFTPGQEQGAKLKALLEKGADPNLPLGKQGSKLKALNPMGIPPLIFCILVGMYDIAMILLRGGADPMRTGSDGMNAIHAASFQDKYSILKGIEYGWCGVDWDYRMRDRSSALDIAVMLESTSAILFLGRLVRVNHLSAGGLVLPIHLAAKLGKVSNIRALHQADADLGARGKNGMTALHLAAKHNRPGAVRALLGLKKGLSGKKDDKGRTPFGLARTPKTIKAFRDGHQAGGRGFKGSG